MFLLVESIPDNHYAATQAEFPFQGVRRLLFKSFPGTPMLPQRRTSPFRDREVFIRIFSRRHSAATEEEFPFQEVRRLLFKSFPGTTMLPQRKNAPFRDRDVCSFQGAIMLLQRQNSPFRDRCLLFESFPGATMPLQRQSSPFREWDVCYSNLFKAPLCCQNGRYPLSGIDLFASRIFSRREYASTKTEFPSQGVRRLLFKSFWGTTMPPQRQSSPFRDRYFCYSSLFQPPLCCLRGRIPLSGINIFVSRIFSRRNFAATRAKFPFQG